MHDLTTPARQAADHEALFRTALHREVAAVDPRPALAEILTAARRCEPWLIALLAVLQLAVITIGLAALTHRPEPPPDHPLPSTSPQPSPTPAQET